MKRIFTLLLVGVLCFSTPTTAYAQSPTTAYQTQEDLISVQNIMMYSSNYLLMDMESGQVLTQKNGYSKIHPASITKVLTLITALEMLESQNVSLKETYTIPAEVVDDLTSIASVAGFEGGDTVTIEDILYAIILPSGADATRAISMRLTQDPEGLAQHMNATAAKIGMKDSNFLNTSGLDEDDHLSTPYDLALLVQYAMKNKTFAKIYSTVTYTTSPTPTAPNGIELVNRSLEAAHDKGFTDLYGAKSGYTEMAERSLSSVAKRGDSHLIFISTNAPNEDLLFTNVIDAINVYSRVFDDFKRTTLVTRNTILQEIPILHASSPFPVMLDYDIVTYLPNGIAPQDVAIDVTATQPNFIAPVSQNTDMAKIKISYNTKTVFETQVLAPLDINVKGTKVFMDFMKSIGQVVFIVFLILGALIITIREINRVRLRKRRMLRRQQMEMQRRNQNH